MDISWIIWSRSSQVDDLYNPLVDERVNYRDSNDEGSLEISEANARSEIKVTFSSELKLNNGEPMLKITVKLRPKGFTAATALPKQEYEVTEHLHEFLRVQSEIRAELRCDIEASSSKLEEVGSLNLAAFDHTEAVNYN